MWKTLPLTGGSAQNTSSWKTSDYKVKNLPLLDLFKAFESGETGVVGTNQTSSQSSELRSSITPETITDPLTEKEILLQLECEIKDVS